MNDGACGSVESIIHFHALPGHRVSNLIFYLDSIEAKTTHESQHIAKEKKEGYLGDSLASQRQIIYNCIALMDRKTSKCTICKK